jgi:aryl-alcohol dehydrogenase-like predicted oxidoreductase
MRHVRLGKTGLKVSRLCLGTATFGVQCDEPTSHSILDRASELGVTFLDTADKYPLGGSLETNGRSEEIVGRWLKGRREQFIVATKVHGRMGESAWDTGNSRKHILSAVEASLRRLGTDYIDLYQLHRPDPETPILETLEALDDLVRSGKVRYVGCSNFLAYQVAVALGRSEAHRLVSLVSVQPCYNLLFRQYERELLPLAQQEGLAVLPYNLLAGGLLSGKHQLASGPTPGTRFTLGSAAAMYQDRYWSPESFEAVALVAETARQVGVPVATLAVAWVLSNPVVTSAIVGASRPAQLDATLDAAELGLDPAVVDHLDKVTHGFRFGDALE